MSWHIELERVLLGSQGENLLQSEMDHVASCELCLELLIFFQEEIGNTTSPEKKVA